MENRKRGQGEADGRPVELQAIENWLLQSNLAFVAGAVCVNYNIPLVIFHRPISLCYPLHKHRGPLLRSLLQKIYRRFPAGTVLSDISSSTLFMFPPAMCSHTPRSPDN